MCRLDLTSRLWRVAFATVVVLAVGCGNQDRHSQAEPRQAPAPQETGPSYGPVGGGAGWSVDPTRPYLEVKYDHAGPRKPVEASESRYGVWFVIRNNSTYWVQFYTFTRFGNDNPGELLEYQILREPRGALVPDELAPRAPRKIPLGYSGSPELKHSIDIRPGVDLLFSVPADHLLPGVFLRIEPMPWFERTRGSGPRMFLDFSLNDLSLDVQTAVKQAQGSNTR